MRVVAGVLLFVVAFAASADPQTTQRWTERLQESVKLLKANEHARALTLNDQLVADMVEKLGPGDAATAAFALALTHKALAHAGLGQRADALWHWHTVLSLYPQMATHDLSMFGSAGAFLMEHRRLRDLNGKGGGGPAADAKPPVVIRQVKPNFPSAARHFGVEGQLVVKVLVATDGTITQPQIVQPLPAPTLSYTALSAIRQWRFKPAMVKGEPVPFIYHVTVNYKLN
jgi:TonB family protein